MGVSSPTINRIDRQVVVDTFGHPLCGADHIASSIFRFSFVDGTPTPGLAWSFEFRPELNVLVHLSHCNTTVYCRRYVEEIKESGAACY